MDKLRTQEEAGLLDNLTGSRALRKFRSNKLAVGGLIVFLIILVLTYLAPVFTKYDPMSIDLVNRVQAPSSEHLLGTDKTGRDVYARVLYGGRISIFVGLT